MFLMRLCERTGCVARIAALSVVCIAQFAFAQAPKASPAEPAKYPQLPSETPAQFNQITASFNYDKRDVMIPMRDGVKLHAIIVVPKGAKNAAILFTLTPYNAESQVSHNSSPDLASILQGYDNPTDVIVE